MSPQSPNPINRSIALIGYRGSGKTTVGRALATMLGMHFLDTDEKIVTLAGKSITRIFQEDGEDRFRALERQVIGELRATPPSVISVGGGAVVDPENVVALGSVATIVWLTAPADVLADRILADKQSTEMRPALTGQTPREEIEFVLRERTPLYEKAADHNVVTEDRNPANIATSIAALLQT